MTSAIASYANHWNPRKYRGPCLRILLRFYYEQIIRLLYESVEFTKDSSEGLLALRIGSSPGLR
jgi:hypothetical protein